VIADSERLRGVRLKGQAVPGSEGRATLVAADPASPAIRILGVSDVQVRDFRIEAGASSAILIAGTAAGVTIENVLCHQREEGDLNSPSLLVEAVCPPDNPLPIVLRNSVIDNPVQGQCVLVNGASPRAPSVRLEGNRFLGLGGAKVFFFSPPGKPVGKVVICDNLFLGKIEKGPSGELRRRTTNGVSLDLRVVDPEQDVRVYNNTFLNVKNWLGFVASAIPGPRLTVCNNLILGSDGIETTAEKIPLAAKHWLFVSNWWEPLERTAAGMRAVQEQLATVRDRIDLMERNDWNHPDLLRPVPGSPLETAGYGKDGLPSYVRVSGNS
jgi:hypothetical protein